MARRRMAPADAAWLHMDRPLNHMIVNSVMWFDEPLDWDAVRGVLAKRLVARFPRFSQRVVELPGVAWWQDDPDFDLEAHLHHAELPAPGGRRQLAGYLSSRLHEPLPSTRPLWQMHLLDGYRGHGSAVVARIHHCIADGIALSRVLISLTDDPDEAAAAAITAAAGRPGLLPTARRWGGSLAGELVHPVALGRAAGTGVSAARSLVRLLVLPPDNRTSLHGRVELAKRVLWSDPVPLARVRDVAHAAGVTVNDLVLAAITGALRGYLARTDGDAHDVRALLPVNLRPPDRPLPVELGNRFGLAYLDLPVSVDAADARLAEVHRRTAVLKRSPESAVTFGVLDVMGRTPYGVEQSAVSLFAAKGSAVITNVAGPKRPVLLAGRRVRGMVAWPPESGNIGLGLSIVSYDGELVIGLLADEHLVTSPEFLLSAIDGELAAALRDTSRGGGRGDSGSDTAG